MVNRARPARNKRERERAKQEKQKEKAQKRVEAKLRRGTAGPGAPGEDPDIAGIVPGPQASPWGEEFDALPPEFADDEDEETEDAR
jgi:hypothetical protein